MYLIDGEQIRDYSIKFDKIDLSNVGDYDGTSYQILVRDDSDANDKMAKVSPGTAFNKDFGTSSGQIAEGDHTHDYDKYDYFTVRGGVDYNIDSKQVLEFEEGSNVTLLLSDEGSGVYKLLISADDQSGDNYYLTGITGSANGEVTFEISGATNQTFDFSHTHDQYFPYGGGYFNDNATVAIETSDNSVGWMQLYKMGTSGNQTFIAVKRGTTEWWRFDLLDDSEKTLSIYNNSYTARLDIVSTSLGNSGIYFDKGDGDGLKELASKYWVNQQGFLTSQHWTKVYSGIDYLYYGGEATPNLGATGGKITINSSWEGTYGYGGDIILEPGSGANGGSDGKLYFKNIGSSGYLKIDSSGIVTTGSPSGGVTSFFELEEAPSGYPSGTKLLSVTSDGDIIYTDAGGTSSFVSLSDTPDELVGSGVLVTYHDRVYEVGIKSAFNKDFGTTSDTVARGNHSHVFTLGGVLKAGTGITGNDFDGSGNETWDIDHGVSAGKILRAGVDLTNNCFLMAGYYSITTGGSWKIQMKSDGTELWILGPGSVKFTFHSDGVFETSSDIKIP